MMLMYWSLLLFALPLVLTAPTKESTSEPSSYECKNPRVRKEWRTLSSKQRKKYHKAVKCLQDQPSRLESELSKNLFDDFSYVHYNINTTIHKVAAFFPWHRYFIILREEALAECGYDDPMPYWDWTGEGTAYDFNHSTIFDPDTGFGGNGVPIYDEFNSTCVQDGPYADLEVNFPEHRCLTRNFNVTDVIASNWTLTTVQQIHKLDEYVYFWNQSERLPHDNIHRAINGDMRRQWSPNDPLFFLHHAQVDRLWTQWQGRNKTRLYDYYGNSIQNKTFEDIEPAATLEDTMKYMGIGDERSVESLMDTLSNGLCYTYDSWMPEDY